MKSLKRVLVWTYIVLIILLLLSLIKCDGPQDVNPQVNPPIQETFKADVVLCIDCTGSMGGMISKIKDNALNFYSDMKGKCLAYGKEITSMRIKVIGFRDVSDSQAYEESPFYVIPRQAGDFQSFVSHLEANGGGDGPEMAYDALGLAIDSEWLGGSDVHQVIILWTDAPSHPLSPAVPGPTSFQQMTNNWNTKMSTHGKRLIIFAPDDVSWTNITGSWDKTIRHDVNSGSGLSDVDYENIVRALSESI